MILETLSNATPMPLCGMSTTVDATNIKIATSEYSPDFCYCMYECTEIEPVWGGGIGWQNDKTTFLFKKQVVADTGVFTVWKNGTSVATITDNSYGEWKATYTSDALQYSFIADWNLILAAFGYGQYQIKNTYTSIGVANIFESRLFELSQFSDYEANGWVKFQWTQDGIIDNSNFTFTEGINFSFKMQGDLIREKPETIKDSYQTSSRQSKQFRTEQKNKYSFNSKLAKATDLKMINENMVLSNYITTTDFNLWGTNIRDHDMDFIEVSGLTDFLVTRKIVLSILFGDYEQGIVKTNC